jgi:hypothetical protein
VSAARGEAGSRDCLRLLPLSRDAIDQAGASAPVLTCAA